MIAAESTLTIDRQALEQLAALLLERVGLKITPDGYYGLRMALQARMPASGVNDGQEYVRRLRQLAGEHELRSLLPLVTVGKTEFFRDSRQFNALEAVIFPDTLATARKEKRSMHIWSAGCATGEEPYSLAMVAMESQATPDEVDIWATDLNPVAVQNAKRGHFPVRRMVGVSEERLDRFFELVDDGYAVVPALNRYIRFEGHNLAAPVFPMIRKKSLDIILCRNVIIYFDQPTIRALMDRFYEALRPGGTLLLGYSESLFRMETRFEMFQVGGTFAYRRPYVEPDPQHLKPGVMSLTLPPFPSAPSAPPLPRSSAPFAPPPPLLPLGAKRDEVPKPADVLPPRKAPELSRTPVERLQSIAALMEKGEFPRALLAARRLVDDQPDDLAALLTLGNIHALMRHTEEARETFNAALHKEPLCVEARVYLALAEMQASMLVEARLELTRALFLEPNLILGFYLLGQVCERLKDFEAARRNYRNAVTQKKTPWRPLLGHYPEIPETNDAIAQAANYRLAALSENDQRH